METLDWFGYIIPKLLMAIGIVVIIILIVWAITRLIGLNKK
jgi:uncharacterized membrane protein